MRKLPVLNMAILIAAVFVLAVSYQQNSIAQEANYYRTFPYGLGGGQVGFFDQQSGRVYVYDNDLKRCIYITRITELGQPMERLKSDTDFYRGK